jgi:1,4-dihydroxy-2-naphthoate octaprenyltransferase
MVNVRMWGKALVRMPRVTPEEWHALDVVAKWLISTRAAVLTMTLSSCLLGGGLAMRDGRFSWPLWLVTTFGLLMAHATNNLINDWTDHRKGTDKGNYFRTQYGVQPIEQGLMTMREFYGYVAFTGGLALLAGFWLLSQRSGHVLTLFGAGIFFVLFYTWPLKYFGFGEFAVIAVWGPLMVGGTYYVVTGEWSGPVALAGTAYALGPTQVIFGKHIDKLQADELKKVRTLPVIIGERAARAGVTFVMVLQYALIVYLVWTRFLSVASLLAFLSLGTFFKVLRVYGQPRPAEMPKDFLGDVWPIWFAAWSFLHGARVGLFWLIGVLAELLFPAVRDVRWW